jgi:hypothetical protein
LSCCRAELFRAKRILFYNIPTGFFNTVHNIKKSISRLAQSMVNVGNRALKIKSNEDPCLFVFVRNSSTPPPPRPLVANKGRASSCHTERRKTEGREVAMATAVADGGTNTASTKESGIL